MNRFGEKTKLTVHLEIFCALALKTLIHFAKEKCFQKKISDCGGDQKQLFRIVNFLLGRGKLTVYQQNTDSLTLASVFNKYFTTKIADIRKEFLDFEAHAAPLSVIDFENTYNLSSSCLSSFTPTTVSEVQEFKFKLLIKSNMINKYKDTCEESNCYVCNL